MVYTGIGYINPRSSNGKTRDFGPRYARSNRALGTMGNPLMEGESALNRSIVVRIHVSQPALLVKRKSRNASNIVFEVQILGGVPYGISLGARRLLWKQEAAGSTPVSRTFGQ